MKVLIINPGATSTKIAVFDEEEQLFKKSIDHSAQELDRFDRVIDQADFRQKAILDAVTEGGFRLTDFAAVCGSCTTWRPRPTASTPPTWGRIWPGASATWWASPPFSWIRCAWTR